MTEMTDEQRQQMEVVAERVATKLKGFYDSLPADEQQALAATMTHNLGGASEQADDSAGFAIMIGGLWFAPPADDGNPAVPPTRVGVSGPTFNPPRLPGQPRTV